MAATVEQAEQAEPRTALSAWEALAVTAAQPDCSAMGAMVGLLAWAKPAVTGVTAVTADRCMAMAEPALTAALVATVKSAPLADPEATAAPEETAVLVD